MTKRGYKYCIVCEGCGGWDKNTYKARFKQKSDTSDTYMGCFWCGLSNVIRKVTT